MTEAHGGGDSTAELEVPDVPAQPESVDLVKGAAATPTEPTEPTEPSEVPGPSSETAAPPAASEPITFQSMADRLTLGLLAAVIGSVLVFVSAFLTWATVDARSSTGKLQSGATTDSIGLASGRLGTATLVLSIAALAIIAVMLLPATKPWAWQVLLGSGVLIVLLALYDLATIPRNLPLGDLKCADVHCSIHRSIGPGVWFTVVTGLLVIAGAYVHHVRPVPFRTHAERAAAAVPDAAPAFESDSVPASEPADESGVAAPPVAQPVEDVEAAPEAQPGTPEGNPA